MMQAKKQTILALVHNIEIIPCDAVLEHSTDLDLVCSQGRYRAPMLILIERSRQHELEQCAAFHGCIVEYFDNINLVYQFIELNVSRPNPFATFPWLSHVSQTVQ